MVTKAGPSMQTLVICFHCLFAATSRWVSEDSSPAARVVSCAGTNELCLFISSQTGRTLNCCSLAYAAHQQNQLLRFGRIKMHLSQCMTQGHRANLVTWIMCCQSLRRTTVLSQWGGSENQHSENKAYTIFSNINNCSEYRKLNTFHIVVVARRYINFNRIPFLSYFIALLN